MIKSPRTYKIPAHAAVALAAVAATTLACVSNQGLAAAGTVHPLDAVVVTQTGTARPVTPTLLGLSGDNTTGPSLISPHFKSAFTSYEPGVLRYPGGTPANYWDWQNGWFQPGNAHWPAETYRQIDDRLEATTPALQATGATPMFDLNVLTYNGLIATSAQNTEMLDSQLSMLKAAAKDGWPVKMIELGNEMYLNGYKPGPDGSDYLIRFPTPQDYATEMNPWISAIHQAYPRAQIAVVGTDATGVPGVSARRADWNADVLPLVSGENAVTVHEDLPLRSTDDTPAEALAVPYDHEQLFVAGPLAQFQSYDLPVWVTEFSLVGTEPGVLYEGSWLNGLFVADQAMLYLEQPDITQMDLHGLVGNATTGAFFNNRKGFGSGGPATTPLALTAAGTTLAMMQQAIRPATSAQQLAFSPNPDLTGTTAPSLIGESLAEPSGTELMLENMGSAPVTVSLAKFFTGDYTATQATAPSITTNVTGPSSTTTTTATQSGSLTLAPYSLATVTG
jgi:hypothetical protein